MFDKDLINEYKNKKMPDDMKNNILEAMNKPINRTVKPSKSIKRYVLVYVAVFMSLIIIVSAAVVYNNIQYIPLKGFVEGDYEVFATPEIIKFGTSTIETIMRVQEGKKSELAIIITDDREIFTTKNYKKDLKITTPDGKTYVVDKYDTPEPNPENGTVQISNDYLRIIFPEFPAVNEFVISENGVSVNITLIKNGFDVETGNTGSFGSVEQNGISIMMKQLTKGSKIIAYQLEDKNLDFDYLFGNRNYFHKIFRLFAIEIYDEAGNNCTETGYNGSGSYDYKNKFFDNILILRKRPEGNITKITTELDFPYIGIRTYDIGIAYERDDTGAHVIEQDLDKLIYADVEIPVPANGEEIVYDEGLIIYNHNGLTCTLESVSRKGNEVTIMTNTEYIGENNEYVENIYINWNTAYFTNSSSSGNYSSFKIYGDEKFVKIKMYSINYMINGNWELNFN
jgi:hypothetical protein